MHVAQRIAGLARQGYRHRSITGDVRMDATAASAMCCRRCDAGELHFIALARPGRAEHVALAWCGACLTAVDL
jgi:hypothetical protein